MEPRTIPNLRWYVLTLLFLATVINYVDRQALSIAIPVIRDEYHLTNEHYSWIVFAFLVAYTIMQVVSGKVIDWVGTRKGMAIFLSWWSVAAVLHGLVGSALGLGICRFLLGMGEAGNWPGAVKAVAEWFPPRERALAVGLFNSGSSIGAVLAPPVLAWTIVRFGWRTGFVGTGALGLLWLIAWFSLYQVPEKHPRLSRRELAIIQNGVSVEPRANPPVRWASLFRHRAVWALMAARALSDPVWWFYVFWLPEYLKRQRSFSLSMIGMLAWIPFFTAGIGGFFGGGLSSYLIRRGWSLGRARKSVLLASAGGMLAGIPAALTGSASWSLVFISVATFFYSSWAAMVITLPTDIFPKQVVASVYGIAGTAAGLGGMGFTLITGKVVDRFSYLPVFVAAGVLPVVAAAVLVTLIGPIRPLGTLVNSETAGVGAAGGR